MIQINVQEALPTDLLSLLLPLAICCMIPSLFRQPSTSQETTESDAWYVSSSIQETYDSIVKEADEWREKAVSRKKSFFSSFSRKRGMPFVVDQSVPPRLYRVKDNNKGEISFELTDVEDGGTSIKSTYNSRARVLIQNFKAKMPARIPTSGPKTCPSCGKEMMPEFTTCPFCGTKLK